MIELLVVIAIIAILAAILLPVLAAAKAKALQAQCINNTKELQIGWMLYATDNQDYMIPNNPYIPATPPPQSECWCPNQNVTGAAMNWTTDIGNTNISVFAVTILAPYMSGQLGVYRCPADDIPSKNGFRVRSYSMQSQVGNLYCKARTLLLNPGGIPYIKITDLHSSPGPSDIIVFLDENPDSLLNPTVFDGYLEVDSTGGTFPDVPGSNHKWGCGMSFADGHSEMHHWLTPALKLPVVAGVFTEDVNAGTLNKDWYWFATHTAGLNPGYSY